jgi:hypothetical protein
MIYGEKQLTNIVAGAALLGAGGGGSVAHGKKIAKEIIESNKKVEVVDPRSISDDAVTAMVAMIGAPSVMIAGTGNEHLRALEMFNANYKQKLDYIVPGEVGAGNSLVPLHASAFSGIPAVNGDSAGRAVPELQDSSFNIYGVPISPMSLASAEGEGGMIFVNSAESAESICRAMTTVFGNIAGFVSFPMKGSKLKEVIIPDTYTMCERVGEIISRLKPSGERISEKLQKEFGMVELGRGLVTKRTTEVTTGFDRGVAEVEGKDTSLTVLFKNENIIAMRKGKIVAMIPDLVCWLSEDGDSLSNAEVEKGRRVIVLGLTAHKVMRTKKALAVFRHLYAEQGHDVDYRPLQK